MDAQTEGPTPRAVRHRLLKMERWYRRREGDFSPEDQVFFRVAFEYAEAADHADTIAEALRRALALRKSSV